jgi:hypothetical protein
VLIAAGVMVAAVPKDIVLPEQDWPVRAVEFIRVNPTQFTGNMFNQYKWGGYLMWYLPEHKTFVDGRTDFFGERGIREFSQVTAVGPDWQKPLVERQVAWVMMPADHRLNLALGLLPTQWSCVYSDAVARVWRKRE